MGAVSDRVAIIIIAIAIIDVAGMMMTLVNGRGTIVGVDRLRGNGLTGIGRRSHGRGNTEIGRLCGLDRRNRGDIEIGMAGADEQRVEEVHSLFNKS